MVAVNAREKGDYRVLHILSDNCSRFNHTVMWFILYSTLTVIYPISCCIFLQMIVYFTLSGFFRSVSRIFYDFSEEFSELINVHIYAMAATGPNILAFSQPNEPSEQQVLEATCYVHSKWKSLEEIYYNRVSLTNKLGPLLSNLQGPLKTIYCYHCYLNQNDISYLAHSHHAKAVEALTLDYNKLEGLGEHICSFVANAQSLKILHLKGTGLAEDERINLLCALQECPNIHTLVLYEDDNMVSMECYEMMVQLSCNLSALKTFYLFPLRYGPFDQIYRQSIVDSCQEILVTNNRLDIELWYSWWHFKQYSFPKRTYANYIFSTWYIYRKAILSVTFIADYKSILYNSHNKDATLTYLMYPVYNVASWIILFAIVIIKKRVHFLISMR